MLQRKIVLYITPHQHVERDRAATFYPTRLLEDIFLFPTIYLHQVYMSQHFNAIILIQDHDIEDIYYIYHEASTHSFQFSPILQSPLSVAFENKKIVFNGNVIFIFYFYLYNNEI